MRAGRAVLFGSFQGLPPRSCQGARGGSASPCWPALPPPRGVTSANGKLLLQSSNCRGWTFPRMSPNDGGDNNDEGKVTTPPYPPRPSPLADALWMSRSSIVTKSRLQMAMWSGVHLLSLSLVRRRQRRSNNRLPPTPSLPGPAVVMPAAACRGDCPPGGGGNGAASASSSLPPPSDPYLRCE